MKQLTILAAPISAVGHVNACLGALSAFLERGHRVIFMLEEVFKGKAACLGFEECIMVFEKEANENPGERIGQMLFDAKVLGDWTVEEKMANVMEMFHSEKNYNDNAVYDEALKKAIAEYQPDMIFVDHGILLPAIYYSGVPFVFNISAQPLMYIRSEKLPPGGSGYPSGLPPSDYANFLKFQRDYFVSARYNDFIEQKLGYARFPGDEMRPETQILTVYGYPNELDYPEIESLGWFNVEVFDKSPLKQDKVPLEKLVPAEFFNDTLDGQFSGSWIYVSLGSMGGFDVELMKRLTTVLGKTKHKYIVSKGARHAEYDLPRNMWGDRYVPQMKLMPNVDLVITHGGNNTVTETFSLGKPMIVLPMFGDQFDNAQRLVEKGLGKRLNPYQFTDEELVGKIDEILNDTELQVKLQNAAKRIAASKRHEELVDKIEQLLEKN